MLGVTSTNKYFIYYASTDSPDNLTAKDLPASVSRCLHHTISSDGKHVAVSCQLLDASRYALIYAELND